MEDVVSCAGAVCLRILPIEVMVVDEGAVENHAFVRRERRGKCVGSIGRRTSKAGGTGLPFAVGLHGETGKVGNKIVDFVDLGGPPLFDCGIERIIGVSPPIFCGLAMSTESPTRTP